MTALNESRHLAAAVRSVFDQDYAGPLELVVAVGPSRDDTEAVARELAGTYPRLTVLTNPTGRTPAGLNIAIATTDPQSQFIIRTDGHAELPPDYVHLAVENLQQTGAANVGGMMVPEGTTPFECAVARAMSRRIGLGSVSFHVGGVAGPAPTVYLGSFRRDVLAGNGGFDEKYTRAQDWELNHRIQETGGLVWFDPRMKVAYRPRPNIHQLFRQFRLTGMWRWQIIRDYPSTASVRYLAAPGATLAIVFAVLVLLLDAMWWQNTVVALIAAIVPVAYLLFILVGSVLTGRGLSSRARLWYPIALVTMHLSWGAGFLWRSCTDILRGRFRPRAGDAANQRRSTRSDSTPG